MPPKKKRRNGRNGRPKQKTAWNVPPPKTPSPGELPDVSNHTQDLLARYAMKNRPDDPNSIIVRYLELFYEYNDALARRGFTMDKDALESLDCIDLLSVDSMAARYGTDRYGGNVGALLGRLCEDWSYICTPCFPEGVLSMRDPVPRRAYFKVLEMDPATRVFQVLIQDYQLDPNRNVCVPGVRTVAEITQPVPGQPRTDPTVKILERAMFTDLYVRIKPRELPWGADDCRLWEQVVLRNASDQLARFRAIGIEPAEELASMFITNVAMANYYLSDQRPVIERTPKERTERRKAQDGSAPKPEPDPTARRVRRSGPVRFVSAKPPKRPTEKTVRHYKLASWTARGHVRTYKSGKKVYVAPCVRHRKALRTDAPAPASTVKILPGPDPKGGN